MQKLIRQYWLIILIWLFGLFFRCYRQSDLLGFYYDQGRDAKMASDIIHLRNFPAIGPTTGIQGIILGPFWYYFITPGYLISGGDPVVASQIMAFIESLTIILLFYILKKYTNQKTAHTGAFIWSFGYYLIRSSRWFSNPTPIPLFALLIIFFLIEVVKYKKFKFLPFVFLFLGLSLQLEAASAIFFIPSILLFAFINKKVFQKISFKYYLWSIFAFGILLLPQLAFELKNNFFVTRNILSFLSGKINTTTGSSWGIPSLGFIVNRLSLYYKILFSKLDTNVTNWSLLFLLIFVFGLVKKFKKIFFQDLLFQLSFIWLFVPLIILLFFQGNYGVLYDYYLTGFFIAFIILFSYCLNHIFDYHWIFIIAFVLLFLKLNLINTYYYLRAGTDGPENIVMGNITQSLNYYCQQNKSTPINLDIYVPPYIPHSYEYLLGWYEEKGTCQRSYLSNSKEIVIIYEIDLQQPNRLKKWLSDYDQKSTIIEKQNFGGVRAEKRFFK